MLHLRWLFFDLGNTIWKSSTPESRSQSGLYATVGQRILEWLRQRGHPLPSDGAVLAASIWEAVDASVDAAEKGAVAPDPGSIARQVLASRGIRVSAAEGRQLWRLGEATAPERGITLAPDALPTLDTLSRRGIRLGVITNRMFGGAHTRRDLDALGVGHLFEHVIVSADVGYLKPHPRIFQAALDAARARQEDCAMVGDNMRTDIQGAKDAGLYAIWKRSRLTACDRPVTPDLTVDVLADLLEMVGSKTSA